MRRQSSGTWGGRDITKRIVRQKEEAMVTGCDAQRTVDVHAKRAAPEIALSSRGPQRSAPSAHQARALQESFVRHALKIIRNVTRSQIAGFAPFVQCGNENYGFW